ncbi:hypothetical protein PoB_000951700 [Plakobranchus ocellatus]|uniref:Uncharacterized protein n=1 Tax=Plakobranchus ocellatus TaxID=259542 RepID=A0AAV3YJF8_9GAST|nr:hypothetical protein PoB_000951700 [Plakobranchus ocellatus]
MEDNVLTEQTHNTCEPSEDEAQEDEDEEETFVVGMQNNRDDAPGGLNGIPGDGHNSVRIINRAGSPWPGGRPECNSIHGPRRSDHPISSERADSPDSIAKSAFSTLDREHTLEGSGRPLASGTANRDGYNTFGNRHSLDRQLKGSGGGGVGRDCSKSPAAVRRDQMDGHIIGEVHRTSEKEEDGRDEEEEDQPLVEGELPKSPHSESLKKKKHASHNDE